MYQSITTIAFYDTLGEDAQKYILNQTKLTTIAISQDYVKKLCDMKLTGDESMAYLKNLVVFEDIRLDKEYNEMKDLATQAGLELYSLD